MKWTKLNLIITVFHYTSILFIIYFKIYTVEMKKNSMKNLKCIYEYISILRIAILI